MRTEGIPAGLPIAPTFRSCWMIFAPGRSTSSSSTRSTKEFNSLDAQYDAASAYIKSQANAGWTLIRSRYDDGGYSGGSTDRPDLQKLLDDIRARKIDVIVVYKVDRFFFQAEDGIRDWSVTGVQTCALPI